MKYHKPIITLLLSILMNFTFTFISPAYAQTNNKKDYDILTAVIPIIAEYKKDILFRPRPPTARLPVPEKPNPTQPVPIYSTPPGPGKFAMVKWLLPGGPPPPAPVLPPLTCDYYTCPVN